MLIYTSEHVISVYRLNNITIKRCIYVDKNSTGKSKQCIILFEKKVLEVIELVN